MHKEICIKMRRKRQQDLFYIHQCVDKKVIEKITDVNSSEEAYDTIMKYCGGDATVKNVRY